MVLDRPLRASADREREAAWLHWCRALGDVRKEVIKMHRPGHRGAHLPSEGETGPQVPPPTAEFLYVAKGSSVTLLLVIPFEYFKTSSQHIEDLHYENISDERYWYLVGTDDWRFSILAPSFPKYPFPPMVVTMIDNKKIFMFPNTTPLPPLGSTVSHEEPFTRGETCSLKYHI